MKLENESLKILNDQNQTFICCEYQNMKLFLFVNTLIMFNRPIIF